MAQREMPFVDRGRGMAKCILDVLRGELREVGNAAKSRDREIASRLDDVFAAARALPAPSTAVPRDGTRDGIGQRGGGSRRARP
jgi:hypothetical protein